MTTLAQHSLSQRILPEYLLYNLLPQLLSFYINWEGRRARAIDQSLSRIPLSCPHPRALGPCGPRIPGPGDARGVLRQMWNESNHPEFSCSHNCVFFFFFVFSTPFQPHDIFAWYPEKQKDPCGHRLGTTLEQVRPAGGRKSMYQIHPDTSNSSCQ